MPPCASTIARQIASPEPDAALRALGAAAIELLEQPLFLPGRQARARDRRPRCVTSRPSPRRPNLERRAGRRVLHRVLEQIYEHLLDHGRVEPARAAGPAGNVDVDRPCLRAAPAAASTTLPTISSSGYHCALQRDRARLEPRHVEDVVRERRHALRLVVDRPARARAARPASSARPRPRPGCSTRRRWPRAACASRAKSREQRIAQALGLRPCTFGVAARPRRAARARSPSAIWSMNVSSSRCCSGRKTRRRLTGRSASTPMRAARSAQRHVDASAPGSVSVPLPAICAVIVHPLRDAEIGAMERMVDAGCLADTRCARSRRETAARSGPVELARRCASPRRARRHPRSVARAELAA